MKRNLFLIFILSISSCLSSGMVQENESETTSVSTVPSVRTYSHLSEETLQGLKDMIAKYPDKITVKELRECSEKAGEYLNYEAATHLLHNTRRIHRYQGFKYSHLSDNEKKLIAEYIHNNPDASCITISEFACGYNIDLTTGGAQAYRGYLQQAELPTKYLDLPTQDLETLKNIIKSNPRITGKQLADRAKNDHSIAIQNKSAAALVSAVRRTLKSSKISSIYSDLPKQDIETLKNIVKNNLNITGKQLANLAKNGHGITIHNEAAASLVTHTRQTLKSPKISRSYSDLPKQDIDTLKNIVMSNPSITGKQLANIAKNEHGITLHNIVANSLVKSARKTLKRKGPTDLSAMQPALKRRKER